MVADGDAVMWSFSCGGGPVAGMTHERHMCLEYGYAGHGGHGGSTETTDSNATNTTESNSAAFSLAVVLFLREFF